MPSKATLYKYANILQNYGVVSPNWKNNQFEKQIVEFVAHASIQMHNKIPTITKIKRALGAIKPELANKIDESRKIIQRASDIYNYYSHDYVSATISRLKQAGVLPRNWTAEPKYIQAVVEILDNPDREYEIIMNLSPKYQQAHIMEQSHNNQSNKSKLTIQFFDPVTKQYIPFPTTEEKITTEPPRHLSTQSDPKDIYQLLLEIRNLLQILIEKL